MERWYRVFGSAADPPNPDALLAHLQDGGFVVGGRFHADEAGWFQAELALPDGTTLSLDRYLASEEGIRAELNTWAAWVETRGDTPEHVRLMERLIQSSQLMTFSCSTTSAAVTELCRFLATTTGGVYQIDGQGIFRADGAPLVAEE